MEINEIRKKTDKELTKLLAEQREELRDLRFKIASHQYKNYKKIDKVRKEIARILSVMNERRHYQEISKSKITISK